MQVPTEASLLALILKKSGVVLKKFTHNRVLPVLVVTFFFASACGTKRLVPALRIAKPSPLRSTNQRVEKSVLETSIVVLIACEP